MGDFAGVEEAEGLGDFEGLAVFEGCGDFDALADADGSGVVDGSTSGVAAAVGVDAAGDTAASEFGSSPTVTQP